MLGDLSQVSQLVTGSAVRLDKSSLVLYPCMAHFLAYLTPLFFVMFH